MSYERGDAVFCRSRLATGFVMRVRDGIYEIVLDERPLGFVDTTEDDLRPLPYFERSSLGSLERVVRAGRSANRNRYFEIRFYRKTGQLVSVTKGGSPKHWSWKDTKRSKLEHKAIYLERFERGQVLGAVNYGEYLRDEIGVSRIADPGDIAARSIDFSNLGVDPTERLVTLLYATNRKPDMLRGFSGERDNKLHYGAAAVSVPEASFHRVGHLERPFHWRWGIFEIEETADAKRHFILRETEALSAEDVKDVLADSRREDILLFVHGFNTSFEGAILQVAQLTLDLQCHNATPLLFSWPSRNEMSLLGYMYDRESAHIAADYLLQLVEHVGGGRAAKRVHILAHSMGNQVALEAMEKLAHRPQPTDVSELILAAPDMDKDRFIQVASMIKGRMRGGTVYASSADKALLASMKLAGDVARAGDVPQSGPILADGFEVIDVTQIGDDMLSANHAAFSQKRSILNDIRLLVSFGMHPPHKRLAEIRRVPTGSESPTHWKYAR